MRATIYRLLVLLTTVGGGLALTSITASAQTNSTAQGIFGALPLSFEQNVGQFNSSVRFAAHGSAYALGLHRDKVILTLQKAEENGSRVNDTVVTLLVG